MNPTVAARPFDWSPWRLVASPELDAALLEGRLAEVNLLLRAGWLAARELLALAAAMLPLDFARVSAAGEGGALQPLAEWSGERSGDAAAANPFARAVLREAKPLYVREVSAELARAAAFASGTASVVGVPLLSGLSVIAVAEFHRSGAPFEAEEARLLWMLCLQAQARLQSAAAAEALRSLALTDPLTGLGNRRYLERELRAMVSTHLRGARPMAALMVDLDRFKTYNDRHGHRWGDRALRDLGRLVRATLRDGDVACRYGGEEFALLLPDTDAEGAVRLAERLREAVSHHAFPPSGEPLSASVGVATLPGDASGGEQLLEAADRALYQAKARGRDRVVLAKTCHTGEPAEVVFGGAPLASGRTGADHVAQLLVRAAMEAIGARRGSLVWKLGERWLLHTAVGFEPKRLPPGCEVEAASGVLAALFKEGRPMVVEDMGGMPELPLDRSRGYATRSFMAIPLYWSGKPVGALSFTNKEEGRLFTTEDLQLILPLVKTMMDCLGGKVREAEERVLH